MGHYTAITSAWELLIVFTLESFSASEERRFSFRTFYNLVTFAFEELHDTFVAVLKHKMLGGLNKH